MVNYTKGTVILAPTTPGGPVWISPFLYTYNISGGAATLNVGDKIVIELEAETRTQPANSSLTYHFDTSFYESKLTFPINITFTLPPPGYGHKISTYSGIHKPSPTDETRTYLSANKHIGCNDCHNPHAAKAGLHSSNQVHVSARTNLISDSGPLAGTSGVEPTWSANNWEGVTEWPTTSSAATKEYQICFKCHASYNTNPSGWNSANTDWTNTTGPSAWTDVSIEFNPANASYHPVAAPLPESRRLPPAFTSLLIGDSGRDSSSTSTTITINSTYKTWPANKWVNWGLRIGGPCGNPVYNNIRRIVSNTTTTLTVDTPFAGGTIVSGSTRYSIEYYAGRGEKSGITVIDSNKNFNLYLPSLVGYVVVVSDDLGTNLAKGTVTSNDTTSFTVDNWTVLNGGVPPDGTVGYYFSATGHTMMCSDCHSNDVISSTAAQGPHGSAVKWMLKGMNRTWPTKSVAYNGRGWVGTSSGLVSVNGRDSVFCVNCHSTITFNKDANGLDSADAYNNIHGYHGLFFCVACHIMVPHGWKIPRLIGDADDMPARYAFNNDPSFNMSVYSYIQASGPTSYQGHASPTPNCSVANCHIGH